MRRPVVALAVLAALAGCTTTSQTEPPIGTGLPDGPPIDVEMRPVELAYGDSLPYLAPETSALAICQAIPEAEWEELLGGPVGRTIVDRSTCVVTREGVTVRLRMRELAPDPAAEVVTIAGHQVRIGDRQAATALLPVGEQDLDAQVRSRTLPVFHVEGPESTVRPLLARLLPLLVYDGPTVPAPDANGEVPFAPTAPILDFYLVDLPAPVRGRVLCTAVLQIVGGPVDQVRIGANGSCDVGVTSVILFPDHAMGDPTETIAGRPATVDENKIYVELTHGVLSIRRDIADRAFAEKLIPVIGDL